MGASDRAVGRVRRACIASERNLPASSRPLHAAAQVQAVLLISAGKLPPNAQDAVTNPAEPATIRLLCVEDSPDDVELMAIALERADPHRRYLLHRVEDASGFTDALQQDFDVILCDFNMPRFSPYAALQILAL